MILDFPHRCPRENIRFNFNDDIIKQKGDKKDFNYDK